MECSLCQSPLAEGATVCGACGAEVLAEVPEISTLAGGRGPDTTGGPPRGEVLAERWEIEERVGADVLMSRYRAHDQETEARVVLTLIAPDLLPSARERDLVRDRLASAVGVGNKYLPGLLDVDREAQFVFAVEPLVVGASLRSVLDARRARNETMHVTEVLPVVAQLAAALAGIAPPHHHGDVRAERVLIGKEGLRLVGAFIVPALPSATVARALGGDDAWRRVLAPEALCGAAGDAADRFGVAAIAFEALTGRLPGIAGPLLVGELEPVEEALRALLAPDAATRPRTLEALIEALAECAYLPIPDLDPAAFRRVRRAGAPRPVSQRPASSGNASSGNASSGAGSPASVMVEPALLAPAAASLDTAPESHIDADATSRMQALNEDGELENAPLAPSSSYPDIADIATDPNSKLPTADGPARAAQILMPDVLPPTYRLDEGPTLAENSLRTRRVVAHTEPPAVVIAADAKPAVAPAAAKPAAAPATTKPAATVPVTAKLVHAPASAKPAAAPASAKPAAAPASVKPAASAKPAVAQPALPRSEPPSPVERSAEPRPRAIAGAAAGGTQEISMDEVFEAAPAKKKRADDSLDPRLVRAALGVSVDDLEDGDVEDAALDAAELETDAETAKAAAGGNGTQKRADDCLDPRLVRAALGVALDAVDDEPPTTMRAAASRPKKSSGDTQQLTSDDLAEMSAAASRRAARVTSDTATPSARRKRDAEPARVVKIPRYEVVKSPVVATARAVPRPAADGAARLDATPMTLPEPRRVAAKPAPAQHPEEPLPPLEAQRTETAARPLPQRAPVVHAEDWATPPPRASSGRAVIWISLALAVAIVCAGAAVAWWRHSSAVRERERVRQERFELLRRQQP